ncbi:LamG-like jellyroll fold domain-containing protein [Winogradskyella wandonensis]|uniref:LamG-like jellyroll fold domain-containing protein n=1 Tax=Winogradskyella wandonensis TaxID=1442586 RepID=UPI001A7E1217|nr:LamG-like jellyroll fold domain-containing protein [Winogradskyella wandonensis]
MTWTVTDNAGLTATATQSVTVNDTTAPTITCTTNITANTSDDGIGNCTSNVSIPNPTFNDNCSANLTWTISGATSLTGTGFVGTRTFNIGTSTITYVVTDGAGLTATCSQTVTVSDDESPNIGCPGNQNVTYDNNCQFTLQDYTSLATFSDNCTSGVTITQSPTPGAILSGATTVTLTATDGANNMNTCTFDVIPSDITNPVAVAQPITVNLAPNGTVNISGIDLENGSSDNCGIASYNVSPSSFTCADVGNNTVTFTVFDNAGNSDSTTTTVTIVDVTPPTALCNDFVVVVDPITRVATITIADIDNGSNDACGISSFTLSQDTFPDNPTAYTVPVTLTVEDVNGNVSSCTANVTVEPPRNPFTVLLGEIINPIPDNPQPPSSLIEVTACPGGTTTPRDVSLELFPVGMYNLLASQVIAWEYSQDNGETWTTLPSSANTLTYTLTGITVDTFVRLRITDADDPTLIRTSAEAYIRFLPPDEPPVIVSHTALDICLTESVTINAESFFDQPNGQFGEGGEFNYAQPDGWRVDGIDNFFPASGNNTNQPTWKETNSNDSRAFSGINYDTTDNTKFAMANGVGNVTTLETPVFTTIGMTAAEAILQFDTSFYFCNGGNGLIELSFDSGNTYSEVLTAYTDTSYSTAFNFTSGNDSGIVLAQGTGNRCIGQTDPRMLQAFINLGQWTGESGLRIRFTFTGSTTSCGIIDSSTFPNPNGVSCNGGNNGNELASGWAIDAVGFAYAQVDDELEWTDENGDVIAIGTTVTVTPVTPGIREYGVTNLVNGCRADNLDGTNFININTSLAYAGQDFTPLSSNCGQNSITLNAYDNTRTAVENFNKGAWETNLYVVPDLVAGDVDYAGTGVTGRWTIENSTSTSCGNTATFSSDVDPDALFTASPGTYTLRWTLQDGSGCYDEVTIIITDCSSVDFDGNNDYVDFKNNYNLNSPFSIEVWIKPESIGGSQTIFSRKDYADNTSGYSLSLENGQVQFNWYNASGTGNVNSGANVVADDRWYHIATTFDGSNYVLYVDGIEIDSNTGSAPDPSANNISALLGAIDQSPPSSPLNHFHGWMDELKIWNMAISASHIRQMMNQEIESSGNDVVGIIIPNKIYSDDVDANGVEDNPVLWSNLDGYYKMNVSCGDLAAYKGVAGRLINIQTSQQQTAPIPYTSRANTSWDTDTTWTHFGVWDVPNSNGINGSPIEWNIVRTNHNIISDTRDITLLGLLVDTNELTISNSGTQDETNTGTGLWVTHYLRLNGVLDLVGESQLIQKRHNSYQYAESILDTSSGGYLERDQQGTTNLFNYNYFSSPVGTINNTANNVDFSVSGILRDGTDSNNPQTILWTSSPNATGTTNPITLSDRWLYAYENYPWDDYASWRYLGNNNLMGPGFGFTMKGSAVGVGGEGGIITGGNQLNNLQNYVFVGKPNNGTIDIPITEFYQALVGNPYASAIDAFEFIDDNLPLTNPDGSPTSANPNSTESIEGSLYFWEHYTSNQTHILSEYQGGYAVLTKAGGLPVYTPALISGAGTSTKTPERYVPVGQGFFVSNVTSDSYVRFENDQRVFQREQVSTGNGSVFFRNTEAFVNGMHQTASTLEAEISRLRLNFTSHVDGRIRPLLLAFTSDNSATDGVDFGYEASNQYFQNNDAFFIIENGLYVIQGVGAFDETKQYPLGIFLSQQSDVEIHIEDLENFDEAIDVYIYDSLTNEYTHLNEQNFTANLAPDYYGDRFFITFNMNSSLGTDDITTDDSYFTYLSDTNEIYVRLTNEKVTSVKLINLLGQTIQNWNKELESYYSGAYRIPVDKVETGPYILKIETETKNLSKKIIIKN